MKYMMNIYVIYNFVNNEVLYLYISWKHRSEGWATHISHPCVLLDAPEIPGMHNPHMASSQKSPLKSDENKWLGISMVYLWGLQELFYPGTVPRVQTRSKHLKTLRRNFMQLQASAAQSRKKRFLCSTSHLWVMIWSETMNLIRASVSVETETLKSLH